MTLHDWLTSDGERLADHFPSVATHTGRFTLIFSAKHISGVSN